MSNLPERVQSDITYDVISKAAKDLQNKIGGSLRVLGVEPAKGYWQGTESPNVLVHVSGTAKARQAMADAMSLVGEQAGQIRFDMDQGDLTGLLLRDAQGHPLPDAQMNEFLKAHSDLIDGATRLENGHFVSNLLPDQILRIKPAYRDWFTDRAIAVRSDELKDGQEYKEHDWLADPQGGTYQISLRNAFGPSVLRSVISYRPNYAEELEGAFSQHSPGLLPPAGRTARVRAISDAIEPIKSDSH